MAFKPAGLFHATPTGKQTPFEKVAPQSLPPENCVPEPKEVSVKPFFVSVRSVAVE